MPITEHTSEHSAGFVGREWVFRAIAKWLSASDGPRVFMLKGEPGSGKTAIAAQLCRIAWGEVPACLQRNFLSAIYFCCQQNYIGLIPLTFVESVTTQLSNSFPAFYDALISRKSLGNITLEVDVHQTATTNLGSMVGYCISFPGTSSSEAFKILLDCLGEMFQKNPGYSVVILVDSLDEAML